MSINDCDSEPEDKPKPPYQKPGQLNPGWVVGTRSMQVMSRNAAMRLGLIKPTAEFPFDPSPEEIE